MELKMIEIEKITSAIWQPRRNFPKEPLDELANSIKGVGLIEPIVVRKKKNQYEIIAGERRWKSMKDSFDKIPCVIRNDDDTDAKITSLIENWQRASVETIDNEKFIVDLYNEGLKKNKWKSANDMSKLTGINQQTLTEIIKGTEERKQYTDIGNLTYDDFSRTRSLKDFPEVRKKVLEQRAKRKIQSQSELHNISKKLAEFPEPEQQIAILEEYEKQEEWSKDAFDTIIEEKKRIADKERPPEWKPPQEEHRWFLDDMQRHFDKIYTYGKGNLESLPKKQRDEAIDVLAKAFIYIMGQLIELKGIEVVRKLYEEKIGT